MEKVMRAKMKITNVVKHEEYEDLCFSAVSKNEGYPADGSDENNSYATWTPTAELSMCVTNPMLFGKFEIDQEFYLDFTKVK